MLEERIDKSFVLETPILFLIFNRLSSTREVLSKIREVKPKRLYVACDGPRASRPGEAETVKNLQKYVLESVDWDCEVKTLFRESNLGCGKAVSSAITWLFEHEELGIILEDDCLPTRSFFFYCQSMLKRFKDVDEVMHVSGTSFLTNVSYEESYYFSKFNFIWGWGTWRRAWRKYDYNIEPNFEEKFSQINNFSNESEKAYWKQYFLDFIAKKTDTWDIQWMFCVWFYNGISVNPFVNFIKNIGFGADATHTTDSNSSFSNIAHFEINYLRHAKDLERNKSLDYKNFQELFAPKSFKKKLAFKLKNILKKGLTARQKHRISILFSKLKLIFLRKDVGPNSFISRSAQVTGWSHVKIGNNTLISDDCWLNINERIKNYKHIRIGNFVCLGRGNLLSSSKDLIVCDYVMTSSDCRFLGSNHIFSDPNFPYIATGTTSDGILKIGTNVWVGAGTTVLGHVTIGHGSVIGAGSVVVKDIPPFSIAVGNPCRVIKRYSFTRSRWINVEDFEEETYPSEDDYREVLKKNRPEIIMPTFAATRRYGDLY